MKIAYFIKQLFGRNNQNSTKMGSIKAKLDENGNYELYSIEQELGDDLTTPVNVARKLGETTTLTALETDLDRLTKETAMIQAKIDAINAVTPPAATADGSAATTTAAQ